MGVFERERLRRVMLGTMTLGAGDVEGAGGIEEIELGVDIDEDGFHDCKLERV